MSGWGDHLLILPILVPLIAGAAMILIGERRRRTLAALGVVSTLAVAALAMALLGIAGTAEPGAMVRVYRLGDWPASFGIVLVLDRLAAVMLLLTGVLAIAALVFALARWHRAGTYFHPLFQFQIMGLNGAFLTGDLFNLFVFFEVMLAASYGLALHGSTRLRVQSAMHYIVINLVASLLFLIGVSVIYGVTGTLNMADLAGRIPSIAAADRALMEAGCAVLGIAFVIKAAIWPLGFWLPTTYAAASAPAAAMLSILSKVGIYAILRLWLLLFGDDAGASAGFGGTWLLVGGLLTIGFGSVVVLAAQSAARLAGGCVLVSSGTLLAAMAMGMVGVTQGALFYLASSVLGIAAFFLLIELFERGRDAGADVLAVTREAFGEEDEVLSESEESAGIAIPVGTAVLGLSFIACALILAGLPPLSGFVGKLAMLVPLLAPGQAPSAGAWVLLGALLVSGLVTTIAMVRTGIDVFWASPDSVARIRVVEIGPVLLLLGLCIALTAKPQPVMQYLGAAAASLHQPQDYAGGVPTGRPPPGEGKAR